MTDQIFWTKHHNRTDISITDMMNVLAISGIRRYYIIPNQPQDRYL